MNLLKKSFSVILVLMLVTFFSINVYATESFPEPTNNYINDFNNSISEEVKNKVIEYGKNLEEKTGIQMTTVVMDTINGQDISTYATNLGNTWGVGQQDKDNGIVIILLTQDRDIFISVGSGIEGLLNDAKAGRFIDTYAISYLKQNDWTGAIHKLYGEMSNYSINSSEKETQTVNNNDNVVKEPVIIDWAGLLGVFSIILIIGFFAFLKNSYQKIYLL